jgi:hypothetical protein
MATNKRNLSEAIGNLQPEVPELRRGEGVKLSIEGKASTTESLEQPGSSPRKDTAPVRIKPGYTIRKDLIRECKRIALETERKVYQVMEEALMEYIEHYNKAGIQTGDERNRE